MVGSEKRVIQVFDGAVQDLHIAQVLRRRHLILEPLKVLKEESL
jgi:hypothetical protein